MKAHLLLIAGAVLHQASAFYYSLEASQKLFDTNYNLDIYTDKNQKTCTYGLSYLTMDKEFAFSGLHNVIFNVVYPECRLLVDNWQPRSITVEECTYSCILANSVANEYCTCKCRGLSDTNFQSTSTMTTTTTRTTSTSHTTATPAATCIGKSKGKKKRDSHKDCCCSSSDDCKDICIKGAAMVLA